MELGVGEFVVAGLPLISVAGENTLDDKTIIAALNGVYLVSRQRTVQQDASFGIRQIVDIAMKALSPGINDTTTAVMCVDYLAAILTKLARAQHQTHTVWNRGSCASSHASPASKACWRRHLTRFVRMPKAMWRFSADSLRLEDYCVRDEGSAAATSDAAPSGSNFSNGCEHDPVA